MKPKPNRKFIERIQLNPEPALGLKLPKRIQDQTVLKTIKHNRRRLKRSFNWDPHTPAVLNGPRRYNGCTKSITVGIRDPNCYGMLTRIDIESLGFFAYMCAGKPQSKQFAMKEWLRDSEADYHIFEDRWVVIKDSKVAMLFKLTFG